MKFRSPQHLMLTIFETTHWKVSHRQDSRYYGHLIIVSKDESPNISDLSSEALTELGGVLSRTEKLLVRYSNPYRVVTAKLGFTTGYSCHFHILPVSQFLLDEIVDHPSYSNEPDGNDALLFASREYCERTLSSSEERIQMHTVEELRNLLDRVD